jgi:hypothetical protein
MQNRGHIRYEFAPYGIMDLVRATEYAAWQDYVAMCG